MDNANLDYVLQLSLTTPTVINENSHLVITDPSESIHDANLVRIDMDLPPSDQLIYETSVTHRTGALGVRDVMNISIANNITDQGPVRFTLANSTKENDTKVVSTEEAVKIWVRNKYDINKITSNQGRARNFYSQANLETMGFTLGLTDKSKKSRHEIVNILNVFYNENKEAIAQEMILGSKLIPGLGKTVDTDF